MPQKLLSRFDPFLHILQLYPLFQVLQDQHGAVPTFLGVNAVTNELADRHTFPTTDRDHAGLTI
ncbi:MAG: hypothetical protein K0S45_4459 [Nitrospira sp.]|jgi:hypothetical protein|nr:hypothetical protein [Nitrospira sp.]